MQKISTGDVPVNCGFRSNNGKKNLFVKQKIGDTKLVFHLNYFKGKIYPSF